MIVPELIRDKRFWAVLALAAILGATALGVGLQTTAPLVPTLIGVILSDAPDHATPEPADELLDPNVINDTDTTTNQPAEGASPTSPAESADSVQGSAATDPAADPLFEAVAN